MNPSLLQDPYLSTPRPLPRVRCLFWAPTASSHPCLPSWHSKPWVVIVSAQLCTPTPGSRELGVWWGGMEANCMMTRAPFKDRQLETEEGQGLAQGARREELT